MRPLDTAHVKAEECRARAEEKGWGKQRPQETFTEALRHVEAARPESPERQLSDDNLRLHRRISELEAELLRLQRRPTQWLET